MDIDTKAPYMRVRLRNLKYPLALCIGCMVVTFILLIVASPQANASPLEKPALLKGEAYISDSVVTVGDIFENAGRHANHVLAPAPQAGDAMILGINDLLRIQEAFNLDWSPMTEHDKVILRRAVTEVEKSDIARLVEQTVRREVKSDTAEIEISTVLPRLIFNGRGETSITVESSQFDTLKEAFTLYLNVSAEHGQNKRLEVEGRIYHIEEVPVLTQALRKGDVIRPYHIKMESMRTTDLKDNYLYSASDLVGMTPRRTIRADIPVKLDDIEKPQIVTKGEVITMTLKKGPLSLTTKGRAMDHGAKGDTIRVMNLSSKRVVEATVNAPQNVNVLTN